MDRREGRGIYKIFRERFSDEESRRKFGYGGGFRGGLMDGRVGVADGFNGELMNPLDERFRGGDEGLRDVG